MHCRILGLQPRDKAAMLVVKTKEIFLLNLHQNRVHFPAERNAFVLDHQHGRRDVTCKPAILCCLPASPAHLKRFRRDNVLHVSTTKNITRHNSRSRSDRRSKRKKPLKLSLLSQFVYRIKAEMCE